MPELVAFLVERSTARALTSADIREARAMRRRLLASDPRVLLACELIRGAHV